MTQSVLSGDLPDRCHSQPQSILSPLFGRRIVPAAGRKLFHFMYIFLQNATQLLSYSKLRSWNGLNLQMPAGGGEMAAIGQSHFSCGSVSRRWYLFNLRYMGNVGLFIGAWVLLFIKRRT